MAESYWLEDGAPSFARARTAGAPDVVVVGGGVTGCAAALALARAGAHVVLHEARQIASGASGRNGGFALRGGALPYDRARERLGRERARDLWRLTESAIDRIESLAGDAFRRVGSVRLAADDAERAELQAELEALREDDFAAEWRDDLAGPFAGAILHPRDGSLQPARWVRRLAQLAADAGAEVRERSRVRKLVDIAAKHVVIATDGYTGGLLPELDAAVRPTRGQVVVTEPLSELRFERPHYARRGYDYWHQTRDRRLVVGGRRDVALDAEFTGEERTTEVVQEAIERLVHELLGYVPAITHRWSGIWGTTRDALPLVGPLPGFPGVWVACGYSGHGNVLGLACGELVAEAIAGRVDPVLALFDPGRTGASPRPAGSK